MKSVSKILSFLLVMLLCVSLLAACGKDPAPDTSDDVSDNSQAVSDTGVDTSDDTADDGLGDDTSDTSDVPATDDNPDADVTTTTKGGAGATTTTKKGNKTTTTKKNGPTTTVTLNNIPDSEAEKWGTEEGVKSTKKVASWMKKIKSGTITQLGSTAYGEGAETQAYKDLQTVFKSLTGKDLKVTTQVVEWNDLRTTLQTLVISGDGPDVFGIYNGVGVYLRNKGLTRDIRDYINMNDACWEDMKEPSEVMFYKGELTGVAAADPRITAGFVYNKTLINQADLDDPYELWKAGKWDIKTFLEYVEELTVDKDHDNNPEVFGVSMAPEELFRIALSSGEDLVKINADGSVSNNLRSATFTRWASYARQITEIGSYDTESWTRSDRFVQGKIAMSSANQYSLFQNEKILEMKKNNKVGWVPYPKDNDAKVHYISAETTIYFLPKNSKNPEGGAAYLYASRYSALNPNAVREKEEKEKYLKEYYWTEDEYNTIIDGGLVERTKPINFNWQHIPDFSYQHLWSVFTEDWSAIVETVYPVLQAALDAQNK